MSNPITTPAQLTKLTLRLKKLKRFKGKRRLQASGAGPVNAAIRVVLRRGTKWISARTVRASTGRSASCPFTATAGSTA